MLFPIYIAKATCFVIVVVVFWFYCCCCCCFTFFQFRHAHQVTAAAQYVLQQRAFLSYVEFEPDYVISSEQWQTQMETEQPQFKYWALDLDLQFCVLRLLYSVRCVQCPTKRMPWRFALDHVKYEMSNFQFARLFLPWSVCCVENKIEKKPWRPLWTTYPKLRNLAMNGFAVLANKCAEEDANASRQLAVHSPVRTP